VVEFHGSLEINECRNPDLLRRVREFSRGIVR